MLPECVAPLDAADPVLQPGRARRGPDPRQRLRVAQEGLEALRVGAELHRERRQRGRHRESATAPPRWRGSRRSAGTPASCTWSRCAPPRWPPRSNPTACDGAMHRERGVAVAAVAPPGRGRTARSWSAGRWTGPRAGELTTTSGSSVAMARPMRLGLERDARPRAGGDAQRAGVGRADGGADRGDLVFGLEGHDAVGPQRRPGRAAPARPA